MISIEIQYKTYDIEPLAIVEVFKTWRNNLKGYKFEVFIFKDHNNF